ncbi:MAG: RIP metalloprotease RseP [bacterium]
MAFLVTFLALGFVIFVHELGHYLVARYVGVRVFEFSIGFGPKCFGKKLGNTHYFLRLFPVGGYVRLAGMDDTETVSYPKEESYLNKSPKARMAIILAGSCVNILSGFIFFLLFAFCFGVPKLLPVVSMVVEGSAAQQAGLQMGDRLVEFNGVPIKDVRGDFIQPISHSAGKSCQVTYMRDSLVSTVDIVPRLMEPGQEARIGVVLSSKRSSLQLKSSLVYAVKQVTFYTTLVFKSLNMLISGKAAIKDLAGPVGIVQMAAFQFDQGLLVFLHFMAIISISLGVVNLFPIPALDGGHFMFLLVEQMTGKPIPQRIYQTISGVAMAILLLLMVFILFNDFLSWGQRASFFRSLL